MFNNLPSRVFYLDYFISDAFVRILLERVPAWIYNVTGQKGAADDDAKHQQHSGHGKDFTQNQFSFFGLTLDFC